MLGGDVLALYLKSHFGSKIDLKKNVLPKLRYHYNPAIFVEPQYLELLQGPGIHATIHKRKSWRCSVLFQYNQFHKIRLYIMQCILCVINIR